MTFPRVNLIAENFQDDIDARIGWCIAVAKHTGYIKTGDTIIGIYICMYVCLYFVFYF